MRITNQLKNSIPFQYALDVQSGKIITGKYVKLAIDRFFNWIENAETKGYRLNHSAGMHVLDFFEMFIQHTKGPVAGEKFTLSPYQQFTLYNIFAWQKKNEAGEWVRVIKTVFEKVARKNGKTAVLSGLGLYCMAFDDESAAEIYVGATKELQAKVLWEQAYQFVFKSIGLRKIGFKNTQREIRFPLTMSVFRFLGGDSKTLDGLNPNFACLDEYHAHPTDGVREVLESAMGARKQPIMYIITTAGFDVSGVCYQYELTCKKILEGLINDDSTFIMLHDLDVNDDWKDEKNWIKANPNLGVSIKLDYLRTEFQKAINQPSKIPNFQTKHLNKYVDAMSAWIDQDVWDKCNAPIIEENFKKFGCTGGLDLSAVTDFTAFANISEPDESGVRDLKVWLFCPKAALDRRAKKDRVPYRQWVEEGYIIATEGDVVDYSVLENVVETEYRNTNMKWVEYDRKFSEQLVQNLMESDVEMSPFTQTITSYSNPTKQLERLVHGGKIRHGGNPVLRWMLSGCVAISDTNENIRISKKHSTKRIDGIIASIMALGGSLTPEEEDTTQSKYNDPNEPIYM